MGFSKFSFSLVFLCFITFVSITSCFAQNSMQDYLYAHNAARQQVGVGAMYWDANLAAYARKYAIKMQRADMCHHLVHSGGPYGENLAAAYPYLTGRQAVNMWVGEKRYYNYHFNKCAHGKVCGHYTQVVWRHSVRLGCARVHCASGWWFVICSYAPRGNIVGQRPY